MNTNIKLACIDVGLKRIGLATCLASNIVTPQNAIIRKNRNQASKEVDEFLHEWDIDELVVGLPQDSHTSQDMQNRIKHFTSLLNFAGKIHFQDESFSSFEAKELMKGQIKQKRDGRIDSLSAKIILDRFLGI
jgi:putative Holliday junction resolvase